jgi:uncharacterized membrane protein YhaH (DUF805 family)
MGLRSLLFSFEGRINRAKYWYVSLAGLCSYLVFCGVMAVLALALGGFFGVTSINVHVFPLFSFHASFRDVSPAPSAILIYPLFYAAETPIFVVGMWLVVATTVKRLHDRNRSGWWIIPFFVVAPLFNDDLLGDSWAAFFLGLAGVVICLWGFIELLFLRGTIGPNRFGPDRLAPHDTGPGWDQQSELLRD